uniref:Ring finger protein 130 n=1 Tax=Anolis carolinensis TaxID=28377 RepID=A0A803SSW6_ANOCA|nr:PREDICTED: E3 ubiquitin-protein ligase RNF130 isoform X2 [Anolis carolinensis]|eukprot:XP_016847241.1 PREDICTED: E3 ubiquitin-protein ligase RNF130 isoform X2 [Anolis carolinensis]
MILKWVLPYWTCISSVPILVVLNCYALLASADNTNQAYYTAFLNVTVLNPERSAFLIRGRYGQDSPKRGVTGLLLAPLPINGVVDRLGCDQRTRFQVPPNTKQWIALLQRGNCTFKQKIMRAALQNASAVVIYNNVSGEEPVTMTHQGTGDIVTVMITELKVKEILTYLEKNMSVLIAIAVGTRSQNKNFSRSSLVFVSISFIVLMIISSAWLIFYFIQKIRYTSARDRNQRRLGDAAKKAVGKLTTRTVKKGDKETDPDFDHCAVCIESYKQNDVVRILPCKHVFHKTCVDPWLSEHCTCPMCKLNILKALGIVTNVPCADNMAFDMERLTRGQLGNRRSVLGDFSSDTSLTLEPLRTSGISQFPQDGELTPRTGEINIAVTSGHFFHRNSLSPRSLVYENDFSSIEPVLDMYDENKT